MIWFACGQCGRIHNRPEAAAGTLVFCTCGEGNTVPWESTAEPPEIDAGPPVPPPVPPRLQPVPVGEERVPPRTPRPRAHGRGRSKPARRSGECFNHPELPAEQACANCGLEFCAGCLVALQGKPYCGPCKNVRIEALSRPVKLSVFAILSACLGMLFGASGFCLFALPAAGEVMVLAVMAALAQLLAVTFGGVALYKIERDTRMRGRSLAITGIFAAGVGLVATFAATLMSALSGAVVL